MATRFLTLVVIVIGVAAPVCAQSKPVTSAPGQTTPSEPASRDEALWREIRKLSGDPPPTGSFSEHLDGVLQRRRTLREKARLYLTLYPGGPHRDEVVRLELKALFDIGTLSGGAYEPLCRRVEDYLRRPPSEAASHEVAYWAIHCRRLARASAASQPSSAPVAGHDAELLREYRRYVEQYPRSRYVPRLTAELFDAAARRGDRAELRRLVAWLRRDFPDQAVTALLAAQLRRREAVGRPFSLEFQATDGTRIDTGRWQGRPVLIVVWAAFSERARACVGQVEVFRRTHPELCVVGVNLDESEQRMSTVCRELGLPWPQFNDGRGWANRFALEWGVREVPRVFVVDRQGRLAGSSGGAGWRKLAASALEN